MDNFDSLWNFICLKNKSLSDSGDSITLSKDNFKKALKLAYDQGCKISVKESSVGSKVDDGLNSLNDLFGGIFGKGKKT